MQKACFRLRVQLQLHTGDRSQASHADGRLHQQPFPEAFREIAVAHHYFLQLRLGASTGPQSALNKSGTRRFAGISLDVFYDHVLVRDWERYSTILLDLFTRRFYEALQARRELLPDRVAQIAARMAEHDWLASYWNFDNVRFAVTRMSGRLSRNGELLRETLIDLEAHYDVLSDGFHVFFPELIAFAEAERAKSA